MKNGPGLGVMLISALASIWQSKEFLELLKKSHFMDDTEPEQLDLSGLWATISC